GPTAGRRWALRRRRGASVVTRPPGTAGAVVIGALAPRQVTGPMAVDRDAEVVPVGEAEPRAALVRRTGPAARQPHRGRPRGTAVRRRPVPDVPCGGAIAVVLPGDPEVTAPRAGRHLREVGPDLGATGAQAVRCTPGPAAVGRGDRVQPHRRLRGGVR